jgi:hypothetical protein
MKTLPINSCKQEISEPFLIKYSTYQKSGKYPGTNKWQGVMCMRGLDVRGPTEMQGFVLRFIKRYYNSSTHALTNARITIARAHTQTNTHTHTLVRAAHFKLPLPHNFLVNTSLYTRLNTLFNLLITALLLCVPLYWEFRLCAVMSISLHCTSIGTREK